MSVSDALSDEDSLLFEPSGSTPVTSTPETMYEEKVCSPEAIFYFGLTLEVKGQTGLRKFLKLRSKFMTVFLSSKWDLTLCFP
jgi:hypothetical protein